MQHAWPLSGLALCKSGWYDEKDGVHTLILPPVFPAAAGVGFIFALRLAAYYEGRVKREYRLYESNAGAGLFLHPHSKGGLRRTEGCATIRAVAPISLHAVPA
jgi:hypothetical protein